MIRDLLHILWFLVGPAPKPPASHMALITTPLGVIRAVTYQPPQ